jgi:hypothetical protein
MVLQVIIITPDIIVLFIVIISGTEVKEFKIF